MGGCTYRKPATASAFCRRTPGWVTACTCMPVPASAVSSTASAVPPSRRRASMPSSGQGWPAAPTTTCATCRWMLPHKERQRSAPAAKTSYLRGASSRVHARIVGLMDYSTRARHDPTNNERGACSKATRGGRWFLRLDGAAEDGPSAPGRGSSGDCTAIGRRCSMLLHISRKHEGGYTPQARGYSTK